MQPHPDPQVLERLIAELDQGDLAVLAESFPHLFGSSHAVLDFSRDFILRLPNKLHTAFVNEVPPFDRRWIDGLTSIAEIAKESDLPNVETTLKQIRTMCFPNS